ncbi:hypothetical protein [Tahibacter soli]|uniref:Uncharacterized protein n=1 Tax=Tahibacter soli TaxID=2983605 RepID=A0A9X3YJW2_9GAMM|nr:hypothetical protein [Tahibacter soli]MDC8013734.1 hypothetical protein [Tahibacter soli]
MVISKERLVVELKRFPRVSWATEAAAILEDYELRRLGPTSFSGSGRDLVPSLKRRLEVSKLTGARLEGIRELIEALEGLPRDLRVSEFAFVDERHSIIGVAGESDDLIGCIVITKRLD